MEATRPGALGATADGLDGAETAALIERVVRGIERGSRGWTTARKKDSLQRVLDGSRSDARRLQHRLSQLIASWDTEVPDRAAADLPLPAVPIEPPQAAGAPALWGQAVELLGGTVQQALPPPAVAHASTHDVAPVLAAAVERIRRDGASAPAIESLEALCRRAAPVLQQRHRLVAQLEGLCTELTASLTDLAEDDSWARGQCEAMQQKIGEGLNARGVRAVSELLRDTRERQGRLREERERARDSLKGLINRMLSELDQLGSQTGHFHDSVGRYADVIEKADSLESLAGAVREMVEESRSVQSLVQQTQTRLHDEHRKAGELTQRVSELEAEMRRLSDEVSTDQLTQIANRRGLLQAFDAERARQERSGSTLSVGLLDIDNFKRLNDELGHGAGDEALRALAAVVSSTLRPTDHVARYGGEEFVVLLPDTPEGEGQEILTRLQRSLSGGLFMHEQQQVFVTFSAGVTAYRSGERIEDALERADIALYEAKRTGKNRTCIG
jgi:diguanylate cyclase